MVTAEPMADGTADSPAGDSGHISRSSLTAGVLVVQRTPQSAAEALARGGNKEVKKRDLTKKFQTEHGVTNADLKAIQDELDKIWKQTRAEREQEKQPAQDVSVPENRPTRGGMQENDAAIIAAQNGWTEDTTEWGCDEPSHTPKGRVYTDGRVYYGADNTGHAGWGFKVWSKKKKGVLHYAGNTVWSGAQWVYKDRGTK